MKFLLSNVPTANAATYSDIHELVMGEIARHHLAHQQSILDKPSSLSKTTAVASSENESLDSTLIDPSPERAALESSRKFRSRHLPRRNKDDASVSSREIMESTMTEMSNVIFRHTVAGDEPSVASVHKMSLDYVSILAFCHPLERQSILTAPIQDFIGYMSTINLISVATPDLPRDVETGNSRHAPSKFLHVCH
ncbi:hypothetical protein LTR55_003553 [Exophiala xenobiotica]|nr:hypothetical protein LTR55_003553 [Exophiala xenobiotica]